MALNKTGLKSRIVSELDAQGFTTSGDHAWVQKLAEAVANAVVDEILANASATGIDSGGDSHALPII